MSFYKQGNTNEYDHNYDYENEYVNEYECVNEYESDIGIECFYNLNRINPIYCDSLKCRRDRLWVMDELSKQEYKTYELRDKVTKRAGYFRLCVYEYENYESFIKGTFWLQTSNGTEYTGPKQRILIPDDHVLVRQKKNLQVKNVSALQNTRIYYVAKDGNDLREIIANSKCINQLHYAIKDGIPIQFGNIITTYVKNMDSVFENFKGDLCCELMYWDTCHVISMKNMFKNASTNPQNPNWGISNWYVDGVKNMEGMFENCKYFNDWICDWNVCNVENMRSMFKNATCFNRNISDWNVGRVKNMRSMFENAVSFNRDIMEWTPDITHLENSMHHMLANTPTLNYKYDFTKKWQGIWDGVGNILNETSYETLEQTYVETKTGGENTDETKNEDIEIVIEQCGNTSATVNNVIVSIGVADTSRYISAKSDIGNVIKQIATNVSSEYLPKISQEITQKMKEQGYLRSCYQVPVKVTYLFWQ